MKATTRRTIVATTVVLALLWAGGLPAAAGDGDEPSDPPTPLVHIAPSDDEPDPASDVPSTSAPAVEPEAPAAPTEPVAPPVDDAMPVDDPVPVDDTTPAAVGVDPPPPVAAADLVVDPGATAAVEAAAGASLAQLVVFLILDVSASTDVGGLDCADENGDGRAGTVLDCEIASAIAIAQALADPSVRFVLELVASQIQVHDFDPGDGVDQLVSFTDDSDGDGVPDLIEALRAITPESVADLRAGDAPADLVRVVQQLVQLHAVWYDAEDRLQLSAEIGGADWRAFLLSPGQASPPELDGWTPEQVLAAASRLGIQVDSVAVGGSHSTGCGRGAVLGQLAAATGGSCWEVGSTADVDCLPAAVTADGPVPCSPGQGAGTLPRTGGEIAPLVLTAAALLLLGASLLLFARRRREALVG
jgi:LPXTG-motif cell wall-anchored protein